MRKENSTHFKVLEQVYKWNPTTKSESSRTSGFIEGIHCHHSDSIDAVSSLCNLAISLSQVALNKFRQLCDETSKTYQYDLTLRPTETTTPTQGASR